MSTQPPTLRVYAVEGRTVFALGDNGRPLIPTRSMGRHSDGTPMDDGELIPAVQTADGRLIPALPLHRSALDAGDIALAADSAPTSPNH